MATYYDVSGFYGATACMCAVARPYVTHGLAIDILSVICQSIFLISWG